jgi:hypothetical protein
MKDPKKTKVETESIEKKIVAEENTIQESDLDNENREHEHIVDFKKQDDSLYDEYNPWS